MPRRNFLLVLAYDGTDFSGWQRLPGKARSVQAEVESALGRALGRAQGLPQGLPPGRPADTGSATGAGGAAASAAAPSAPGLAPAFATPASAAFPPIEVVGAGRTDAGVHAEGQAASFHAHTALSPEELAEALRRELPGDIACLSCREVDPRFHARYRAKTKVYRYRLHVAAKPDPEARRRSLHVGEPLDLAAMAEAARLLVGERDFRAFTNAKGTADSKRRLLRAEVLRNGDFVDLVFEGDGFLYNQVRLMSAALLEVGLRRMTPARLAAVLSGGDRASAPGALGAFGLSLVEVRY